jgi:hypothetical protein
MLIEDEGYYPMVATTFEAFSSVRRLMPSRRGAEKLTVPQAYPKKFQIRQPIEIASQFSTCLLTPDRVVAAIDEVGAEATLAAR